MKFYIQKNIAEKDVDQLIAIFEKHQINYELFYHIPFDDSYPEIDNNTVFVYAASSVTDKIYNDHKVFKGVFAHTEQINLANFFKLSPELMWNEPLYMGSFKNFTLEEEEIFIRPLIDSKWLAGTVLTTNEYEDWIKKLKNIDFDFNTPIFVSKVNEPQNEYRLFFINYTYCTGSQYKKNYELYKNKHVPAEVINMAQNFIEKNKQVLPNSFVVDIGVKSSKNGIIEVNGINNAGFYDAEKEKIIIDLINFFPSHKI